LPTFYHFQKTAQLSLIAIAAIFATPAIAGEYHPAPRKPGTINVSATGTAKLAPDMAIINMSVIREGKTARDAVQGGFHIGHDLATAAVVMRLRIISF